jgi:hypothetical protein
MPHFPMLVHREIPGCEVLEQGATEPPDFDPQIEKIGDFNFRIWQYDIEPINYAWYTGLDYQGTLIVVAPSSYWDDCNNAALTIIENLRLKPES